MVRTTKTGREARKAQTLEMLTQGYNQSAIARELQVHPATVCRMLQQIARERALVVRRTYRLEPANPAA